MNVPNDFLKLNVSTGTKVASATLLSLGLAYYALPKVEIKHAADKIPGAADRSMARQIEGTNTASLAKTLSTQFDDLCFRVKTLIQDENILHSNTSELLQAANECASFQERLSTLSNNWINDHQEIASHVDAVRLIHPIYGTNFGVKPPKATNLLAKAEKYYKSVTFDFKELPQDFNGLQITYNNSTDVPLEKARVVAGTAVVPLTIEAGSWCQVAANRLRDIGNYGATFASVTSVARDLTIASTAMGQASELAGMYESSKSRE